MTRYVLTTRPVVPTPGDQVFGGVVLGPHLDDRVWVHLNVLGSRIPQSYRDSELQDTTDELLDRHHLCSTCRGYGLAEPIEPAAPLPLTPDDEGPTCAGCGGSGRIDLRVDIHREPGGTVAYMTRPDGTPL